MARPTLFAKQFEQMGQAVIVIGSSTPQWDLLTTVPVQFLLLKVVQDRLVAWHPLRGKALEAGTGAVRCSVMTASYSVTRSFGIGVLSVDLA